MDRSEAGKPPFPFDLSEIISFVPGQRQENPPTITRRVPWAPEELEQREAYRARWDAIVDEGEAAGWLEPGHDPHTVSHAPDRYLTVPNPDYDSSKPSPWREGPLTDFFHDPSVTSRTLRRPTTSS